MITIRFDFKDRKKEDLDQLNNILATMKLDELGVEDYKDYQESQPIKRAI